MHSLRSLRTAEHTLALWCLVVVGCPSAPNLLSPRPLYLPQELSHPWCLRPPVGGADGCTAGFTHCQAAGHQEHFFRPACTLASRQELQISHPARQGRRHGVELSQLLFSLCAMVTVTLGCLSSRRAAHTHWHTQRRLHGIYKRRPQTQHTHKPSKTWCTSRVGPKSDGPAWYSMKTTFSTSRLGEKTEGVPPGPLTRREPNSGSMQHGLPKEGRRWVARPHTGLLHREAPEHRVLTR